MQNAIPIYKALGDTPYQAVQKFKKRFPQYSDTKISYAGRLDPMAEGLLLLLVGEENKNRKDYESLPKTYEFTILLGIETDSYDILGKVTQKNDIKILRYYDIGRQNPLISNSLNILISSAFKGKRIQSYPPYSSKAVRGKPLYWWARHNRLNEIEIPEKEIEIYSLDLVSQQRIEIQDLRFKIQEAIAKVQGDFRQKEILKTWGLYFKKTLRRGHPELVSGSTPHDSEMPKPSSSAGRQVQHDITYPILTCRVTCSSGTYVRGLVHEIGKKLDCGAIAFSIKRTSVGNFNISSIIKV